MADDVTSTRFFRPTPTDEYLANPHKGCCTFQRFNGDALIPGVDWTLHEQGPLEFPELPVKGSKLQMISNLKPQVIDGYLPTTVAYCRWFWNVLEPQQGEYDFSMIDQSLRICEERGQTLAVRLMPFGGFINYDQPYLPDWYEKTGAPMQEYKNSGQKVPVYDSAEYFKLWGGVINEFGKRYDGHPIIESIDVAYLGFWGEGEGECTQETCDAFAELWDTACPSTPKLSLVAAMRGDQFKSGVQNGFGWRADCFGDLRQSALDFMPLDEGWNHMFNVYPRRISEVGAANVWQNAPVHFEVGFVPMTWYHKNFDIDFILQQGLKYHTTYFMPKSSQLPEAWMGKLAEFCRKIGYRYVFRQAILDRKLTRGERSPFKVWIENIGIAPIYRKYDFAVRLRQDQNEEIIIFDNQDIRNWLPGDIWLEKEILCPKHFRTGSVEISAGLIDSKTKEAKVSFAVKERFCNRWALLGTSEII